MVQDAGFVAPVVSSVSSRHDRRAILVGINDYMGLRDDLHGPVHDVQAVKELLQTYVGFQEEEILVIENHHATLSNIRDSIESFLGPVTCRRIRTILFFRPWCKVNRGGRPI